MLAQVLSIRSPGDHGSQLPTSRKGHSQGGPQHTHCFNYRRTAETRAINTTVPQGTMNLHALEWTMMDQAAVLSWTRIQESGSPRHR